MSRPDLIGIKVLTIKQPYAGLIAAGFKTLETRSWSTTHRGDLLIHAGSGIDRVAMIQFDKERYPQKVNDLVAVRGCLLCKVVLRDVMPQDEIEWDLVAYAHTEHTYGYWREDHYAWVLAEPVLVEQLPAKGQLGLWTLK